MKEYKRSIQSGPTYICSCCGGLWYKKSVQKVTTEKLRSFGADDNVVEAASELPQNGQYFLCSTCFRKVKRNKVPKAALTNGFKFPMVPDVVTDLTSLEERLVALRLPFMQIRSLGVDRQYGLSGSIVNVTNDLDISVNSLPRNLQDTATVSVMLMRRMCYKSPYMYEKIRPAKVYDAAKYLIQTPVYEDENVVLAPEWKTEIAGSVDFLLILLSFK
jgi:hypothetical protein